MKKQYNFYADPGHGWLAVPIVDILAFNLQDQITPCSYMKGKTAYLEEDNDAGLFVEAYKKSYGRDFPAKIKHTDRNSPIRSYDAWNKTKAKIAVGRAD